MLFIDCILSEILSYMIISIIIIIKLTYVFLFYPKKLKKNFASLRYLMKNYIKECDQISEDCERCLNLYLDFNQHVEERHKNNEAFYLLPIRITKEDFLIKEKNDLDDYLNGEKMLLPVDPLEVTLEHLDTELRQSKFPVVDGDEIDYRTRGVSYYKRRRNMEPYDPSLPENEIRLNGPDEYSMRVNPLPNSTSIPPVDSEKSRSLYVFRKKVKALETSRIPIRTDTKEVQLTKELRRSAYHHPSKGNPFPPKCLVVDTELAEDRFLRGFKEVNNNIERAKRAVKRIQTLKERSPVRESFHSARRKKF